MGLPLPLRQEIQLVHQMVYPTVYNAATMITVNKKALKESKRCVWLTLNVNNLTVQLMGLHKSKDGRSRAHRPRDIVKGPTRNRWPSALSIRQF